MKAKQVVISGELIAGYEVYPDGRIYSLKRDIFLNPRLHTGGYLQVTFWNRGQRDAYVHRVVAEAFILNKENKPCVNHIDGNKCNNNKENLEWATDSENQKHSYRIGLNSRNGKNNGKSKLSESDILLIRARSSESRVKIAEEFGVSETTIREVVKYRSWKHVK